MRISIFIILFLSLTSLALSAQSDSLLSKKYYSDILASDPGNVDAIKAMIVFSELERNELDYLQYVNQLLKASPDPFYFDLFQHLRRSAKVDVNAPASSVISSRLYVADSLFRMRKFDESRMLLSSLQQEIKWSIIGPFANESGSGFEKVYWPETETFDRDRIDNSDVQIVKLWVEQKYNSPDGTVVFDRLLQNNSFGNVYYANTFLELDSEQAVDFRLRRNTPLKMWVNGKLVFSNADAPPFRWDSDIITLKLQKGTHRVLIKTASLPFRPKDNFLAFFDRPDFEQPGEQILNYNFNEVYARIGVKFGLRVTEEGEPFELVVLNSGSVIRDPESGREAGSESREFGSGKRESSFDPLGAWLESGGYQSTVDHFFLAKAFLLNGDYLKGEEFFHHLFKANPEPSLIKYLTAKFYAYNNKNDMALGVLAGIEDSLFFNIKTSEGETDINVKNNVGNDVKAIKKQRKTVYKAAKKRIRSEYNLGSYYEVIDYLHDFGKGKKALRYYDELIDIQPYEIDFRKEKADLLIKLNKYDDAVEVLHQALDISPVDPDLHKSLGDAFYNLKLKTEALLHYQNAKSYVLRTSFSRDFEEIQKSIDKIRGAVHYTDWFDAGITGQIPVLRNSSKYPSAHAIVLSYDKNVLLTEDHEAKVWQEIAIEVKTNTGVADWEEADFSFFGELEEFKVIRSDGSEFRGAESNGYVRFDNLAPGDVIYIKGYYEWAAIYELPGEVAMMNYMSYDIPTMGSTLEVIMPKEKPLFVEYYKGESQPATEDLGKHMRYSWTFSDIEASQEDAIPDIADTYTALMISTMTDWQTVVDWYSNKTYQITDNRYEYKEIIDLLITDGLSDEQKVERIYNWLCQFDYDPTIFLESNYRPKDPVITLAERRGDSKDLSALMIAVLKALDIEAHFVLVKSNQLNHQDILPSILFDHVVVAYKSKEKDEYKFVDLSTNHYPFYVLNEDLNNAYALLIKSGVEELITLPADYIDADKNIHKIGSVSTIRENGDLSIDVVSKAKGLFAGYSRENLALTPVRERQYFIQDNFAIGIIDEPMVNIVEIGDLTDISSVHEMKFNMFQQEYAVVKGKTIQFSVPFMKPILPNPVMYSKNRDHRLKMEYVLQIDPTEEEIEIRLPRGYRIISLPEDVSMDNEFGTYSLTFRRVSNGIIVKKYQDFHRMLIEPEEFRELQEFYMRILKLDQQLITIRK